VRTRYKRVRATVTKRSCIQFWKFTTVGIVFPANGFTTEYRIHERAVEQVSLVRDGTAFSYKEIEYRVTKSCDNGLQCTSYYPHTSVGVRLFLDKAATHEVIVESLANLSDPE
jgi:hypothetical protein